MHGSGAAPDREPEGEPKGEKLQAENEIRSSAEPVRLPSWDLLTILGLAGIFLMVTFCIQLLLFGFGAPGEHEHWMALLAQLPGQLLCWFVGLRIVRLLDPRGTAAVGLGPGMLRGLLFGLWRYVWPVALIWWAALLLYGLVLFLLGVEPERQQVSKVLVEQFSSANDGSGWVQALLVLETVVVAPLVEELFFRGLLFGWLRRHAGFETSAWTVGALFGVMHGEVQTLLPLALLGYLFCRIRVGRGGLWACIAAHAAHNTLALLVALSSGSGP